MPGGTRRVKHQACCNAVTGRRYFDAPPLPEILGELPEAR